MRLIEIYYNFVKLHSAIKMTSAEKAGLVEYYGAKTKKDKWTLLMKGAANSFYLLFTNLKLGQCLNFVKLGIFASNLNYIAIAGI